MKKHNLTFKVISQDSRVELTALAEFKNNRIKFVDEDNNINYVIIKNKTVEYYKKGEMDMKYKFDLNHVTEGYYRVMGSEFNFKIVTNTLEVSDSSLLIEYGLYQNSELVNKTKITLAYETKEES